MTQVSLQSTGQGTKARMLAALLLGGILLLLALRLTSSEQLRETINQKAARLNSKPEEAAVFVGPAAIALESGIMALLAAGAAGVAAVSGGLSLSRAGRLGLIGAICGCAAISAFRAADRFSAIVGLADFAMSLLAGWSIGVLCEVLGDAGRRAVVAGMMAILAICVGKGLLQKFVEFPDLLAMLREHQDELLRGAGLSGDPVQKQLFLARVYAQEVTGYLAFSNVFAAVLIGILTIAAGLISTRVLSGRASNGEMQQRKARGVSKPSSEIPTERICLVLAILLLWGGLVLLRMTGSQGGMILGSAAVVCVGVGTIYWRVVVAARRGIIALTMLGILSGTVGLVSYGLTFDRLPTKSMMFRWHYWTASARMIGEAPVWGVGLNNFGDYYLRYKRASSPEDVKDPHNYFMRIAAEAGMPAAVLLGGLLVWVMASATRRNSGESGGKPVGRRGWIVASVFFPAVWAFVHLAWFESPNQFNIYITAILAAGAAGVFAIGWALWPEGENGGSAVGAGAGTLGIVSLLSAGAMLTYDQINMALVTGPVAMLFWMLLGLADSCRRAAANVPTLAASGVRAGVTWAAAAGCGGCALAVIGGLWMPLAMGNMRWDPAPHEWEYVRYLGARDYLGARAALDAAIERVPNSVELRMQRIALLRDKFPEEPVKPELRQVLALDRANAKIRIELGLPESNLSAAERAAILEEALKLDEQLPEGEIKKLPIARRQEIQTKIVELRAATAPGR